MSTIIASNVSDGTLSIPTTYVTNGSAKAWVNFNGTGTIATRDSLNVSSLTDNGTGDYKVNFSSAMANANYALSGFCDFNDSTAPAGLLTHGNTFVPLTSGCPVETANSTVGGNRDTEYVNVVFQGDLA